MRRLAVLIPLLVVLLVALLRLRGPSPKPETAPAREFSAARAMALVRELLAENVAHPVGTPENARVRDRVVQRFRSLGYETTIQRRFACNAAAVCATVENILARMPGAAASTVAVVAHYDSVGAGPGGSDDAAGTAVLLETARAVRGTEFRNSVLFLVTDGEEAGLLGAEGFVADAALAKDVAALINIEHRGTSGPSYMFETSRDNRWLIGKLDFDLPITSSLFYTIYDRLPNDTDVTIFKRAGKTAINFGALGNPLRYHTPRDDAAHVDPRTLQHGGDNVLAALRALGDADLTARSSGNAVWFDVLGFFLVVWPEGWTLPLAIVSLILLLIGARKTPARAITFGVVVAFATLLVSFIFGYLLGWLAQMKHVQQWVAHPELAIASVAFGGLAAALLVTRKDARPTLIGIAIVWHAIAIALAATVAGSSFLFLVPAIAAAICILAGVSERVTGIAVACVAAVLIFPIALVLYTALGRFALTIVAILFALVTMFVAPLIADRGVAVAALVVALLCAGGALLRPAYTNDDPRGWSLTYLDDANEPEALWLSNAPLPDFRDAKPLTPWNRYQPRYSATAPRLNLPRVELTREDNTFRVRSRRGARRVMLAMKGARIVTINGVALPPKPPRFRERNVDGWTMVLVHGDAMDVAIDRAGAVEAYAADYTYGLPPAGAPLRRAREQQFALPVHDGDLTVTRVRM
jgi:hypothetical protein